LGGWRGEEIAWDVDVGWPHADVTVLKIPGRVCVAGNAIVCLWVKAGGG
jgi:hypothetical protein